jgi:beta-glucanase (GH16 family)
VTNQGGTVGVGGSTGSNGGASGSGGSVGSGGITGSSGGITPSGGATASGGSTGGISTGSGGGAGGRGGITGSGGSATGGSTGTGGSATGGSATGGGTGTGGSATGGTSGTDPFVLSWQDDFNTLNTATWQLQNFTYDGNQATFVPQNASVANGIFTMALTNAASGAAKPYLGVEARSAKTITYGKISARMRFAKGSGVVSGLVLFYTPFPNCDWNEIDIEHLGKSSTSSQLNAMVYTGTYNASCTTSVTPTQDPLVVSLGFDAEADFHQYDIEWTPAGVKYFADGVLLRNWTANISLLKRPMNILLTIWMSNAAAWAGAISTTSVPTSADIDWIKVYDWNG